MKIYPVKTNKIVPSRNKNLTKILDRYLPAIKEKTIVAITSKIISLCEGRVIKLDQTNKDNLIAKEADYYIVNPSNKFSKLILTIKNNILVPAAGIDESNVQNHYVLWPKNSQKSANDIRQYLKQRFSLIQVGVIITDSRTNPLRWGTTGVALAHSGFLSLKDYIGKKDLFGKELKVSVANVADALATAAVLEMGEADEQTPLAVIEDIPFVEFIDRNPSQQELAQLHVGLKDPMYAPLFKKVKWTKGKK